MKPRNSAAPKKSIGKRQQAGHAMGGAFKNVTPKKPEPDEKPPTRRDVKPVKGSAKSRLLGVRL